MKFDGTSDFLKSNSGVNSRQVRSKDDAPMYLTGSRFYGKAIHSSTDFDFFGDNASVQYWKDILVNDGYIEEPAGYFNRSYYLSKGDTIINLISIKPADISLWAFSSHVVRAMFKLNMFKNDKYSDPKMFYVSIFQMLQIVAKPFKNMINSEGLLDDMVLFDDMYPEIIELKDALPSIDSNEDFLAVIA